MPPRSRRAAPVTPARLRVRMYQVGFGDCFLLSFEYAKPLPDGRSDRHLLIDFGTTSLPRGRRLLTVADLIRDHTGGLLDVVVVTHRHKDHLSAFGSQKVVDRLAEPGFPKLVVRSWTEDPNIAAAVTGAALAAVNGQGAAASPSLGLVAALQAAQGFAAQLTGLVAAAPRGSLGADVEKLADDQLANQAAVEQLERWSDGDRGEYLHYGMRTRIDQLIPGISVRVLGPPTVDQHPAVAGQRERDPIEFWMLYQGLLQGLRPDQLLGRRPTAATAAAADDVDMAVEDADPPPRAEPDPAETQAPIPARPVGPVGPVRWLTDRMGRQQLNSLLRIVRILDTALNNTSVILLFEIPAAAGQTKRLLFGGDAQIENWEYALKFAPDKNSNLDRLRLVDLYKVGHHGSRNATPRTLFNLWNEPDTIDREMVALLSTKNNVHGESVATAVPRKTLVAALDTRMRQYETRDFAPEISYVELMTDLEAEGGFVEVVGPP
jgi:hypothetical protein